ncbi:MAG TPA: TMEM165/GDT1 family protein [Coleofasciculaceae cyanobacterium]
MTSTFELMPETDTAEGGSTTTPVLELTSPSVQSFRGRWRAEIKVFLSTFLTIFLAELGDKTQMTTLLISAESQSPWTVFIGAGSALVLTSLLGVMVGSWLAQRFSPQALEKAAGVMLLIISVLLVWDIVQA